jgi:hypothetical protein
MILEIVAHFLCSALPVLILRPLLRQSKVQKIIARARSEEVSARGSIGAKRFRFGRELGYRGRVVRTEG